MTAAERAERLRGLARSYERREDSEEHPMRQILLAGAEALEKVARLEKPPEWVVNSIGELGVKVGDRFFFLYKGGSLEYGPHEPADGDPPLYWRPVWKREFGEVCHPFEPVSLQDGDDWEALPGHPALDPADALGEKG